MDSLGIGSCRGSNGNRSGRRQPRSLSPAGGISPCGRWDLSEGDVWQRPVPRRRGTVELVRQAAEGARSPRDFVWRMHRTCDPNVGRTRGPQAPNGTYASGGHPSWLPALGAAVTTQQWAIRADRSVAVSR